MKDLENIFFSLGTIHFELKTQKDSVRTKDFTIIYLKIKDDIINFIFLLM